MITLTSKQSDQIKFPGSQATASPLLPTLTVTVETGVAIFTLVGTNPHDWTRDTLSFPIGAPCTAAEFASGIACASPASFWGPTHIELVAPGGPIFGTGPGGQQVQIPPELVPQPYGCAVDSALVSYSVQAGQPVLQLALAVFGTSTALLRAAYTAYIVNTHGGIASSGGGLNTKV